MTKAKFSYTPINPYNLLFRLWKPEFTVPNLVRVLEPIGEAIRGSSEYINNETKDGDQDWLEVVAEEETEFTENMLGTAFVVCQTHITLVVSNVKRLYDLFQKREGRTLSGLNDTKAGIISLGAKSIGSTGYTDIQIIDAFANYFKHREEWDHDWIKLKTDQQKKVRDVIVAVGAKPYGHDNIRLGAKVLGNTDYHRVTVFVDAIDSWHRKIMEACKLRLQAEKVL